MWRATRRHAFDVNEGESFRKPFCLATHLEELGEGRRRGRDGGGQVCPSKRGGEVEHEGVLGDSSVHPRIGKRGFE